MRHPISPILLLPIYFVCSLNASQVEPESIPTPRTSLWNAETLITWLSQTAELKPYIQQLIELKLTPEGFIFDTEQGEKSSVEMVITACHMSDDAAKIFREKIDELRLMEQLQDLHVQQRHFVRAKRHSSTSLSSSSSSSLSSSPSTSPRSPSVISISLSPNQSPRTDEKKESDVEMQKQDAPKS